MTIIAIMIATVIHSIPVNNPLTYLFAQIRQAVHQVSQLLTHLWLLGSNMRLEHGRIDIVGFRIE
jgi:hypothetical protein